MEFIDLKKQYKKYKKDIDKSLNSAINQANFIMGPEVFELEDRLSDYVGARCLTTSSGTHSLEIALRALNVGQGDEVITSPFTWISSAEVINLVGAKPIFIDIKLNDMNINEDLINKKITKKTKAIIGVNLFGQAPDYRKIRKKIPREIVIIEDAAQSFGSTQRSKKSCNLADIGSTSFFPAKPFGCFGDGGALFSNKKRIFKNMKAIRTHGGVKRHHHTHVGTNGRMDNIQAAVLLAKLKFFNSEIEARNRVANYYYEKLSNYYEIPKVMSYNTSVFAQFCMLHPKRNKVINQLKSDGIPSAIYYPKTIYEQPVYRYLGHTHDDFPNSYRASRDIFSIPMHPFLSKRDQDKIIKSLIEVA